jgi:hypothetical protein
MLEGKCSSKKLLKRKERKAETLKRTTCRRIGRKPKIAARGA